MQCGKESEIGYLKIRREFSGSLMKKLQYDHLQPGKLEANAALSKIIRPISLSKILMANVKLNADSINYINNDW